jgi:outer membrane protein OmpA-like peptidoglycan-associated protein
MMGPITMSLDEATKTDPKASSAHHLSSVPVPPDRAWNKLLDTTHEVAVHRTPTRVISTVRLHPQENNYDLGYRRKPASTESLQEFPSLNFAHDARVLDDQHKAMLRGQAEQIASYLKDNPGTEVQVYGHASAVGEKSYNQKLSSERARNVVADLRAFLPEEYARRVSVSHQGFGDQQATGNAKQDRRVSIVATRQERVEYHEHFMLDSSCYKALSQKPFVLDLGRGDVTRRIYGDVSDVEAKATLYFTQPATPLDKPAQLNVVVEDVANLRLVAQAKTDADQPTMMIAGERLVNIYQAGKCLAQVHIVGPDGNSRDLNGLSFGVVKPDGRVEELAPLRADYVLQDSKSQHVSGGMPSLPAKRPTPAGQGRSF